MLKNLVALGVAAIVALAPPVAIAEDAPALKVGMPAPALPAVNWLKGEPVTKWEPGQVYVIDFWATWCGPCVASIPHFNKLHDTYKDKGATFIGAAIWPTDTMKPTAAFVESRGDGMSYRVLEDIDNKMAEAFMTASGQAGIPTVMVIDQKGNLAWIGHPMAGLDEVIPAVLKGDFDAAKFTEEQEAAAAPTLGVGDAAPALTDVTWIQGEPVSAWEQGKIYVLDFWATWCGPCVASIPHVNELHNRYKDQGVSVIGVAIWPRETMKPTAAFVEARGEGMSYRIAADVEGKTATAFMDASGQQGIPTVMVIDRTGKIAWIGHPTWGDGLDHCLEAITKDDFDASAFAKEQAARDEKFEAELRVKQEQAEKLLGAVQTAFSNSDWAGLRAAADNLVAFDPKEFGTVGGTYKYVGFVKEGKSADAAAWGQEFVANVIGNDAESLNMFAWMLVQPEGPLSGQELDAKLAVQAAQKADALMGGKDANTLDTLARAYFVAGDFQKAVETEEKALALADNDAMKSAFQESLDEYKAKLAQ